MAVAGAGPVRLPPSGRAARLRAAVHRARHPLPTAGRAETHTARGSCSTRWQWRARPLPLDTSIVAFGKREVSGP